LSTLKARLLTQGTGRPLDAQTTPAQGFTWRGSAQLATDAVIGLTDLVEAMHSRIATLPACWAHPRATNAREGFHWPGVPIRTRCNPTLWAIAHQSLLGWLDDRGLLTDANPEAAPLARAEREALRCGTQRRAWRLTSPPDRQSARHPCASASLVNP
jgi:hypothetical protein